ncbi:hypothetical protein C7S16_6028 [Burkholderia thailandensis]|uniref:Transposase n=1 Tax=Burkholderia thailandensis TaxID=57975 RepID=A0AAW9CS63_BURTH|nr:hypothetical protein [Burkholderia thailandensis]
MPCRAAFPPERNTIGRRRAAKGLSSRLDRINGSYIHVVYARERKIRCDC